MSKSKTIIYFKNKYYLMRHTLKIKVKSKSIEKDNALAKRSMVKL